MKLEIPFTGPSYASSSRMISGQECVNFYLRSYPDLGKDKYALIGVPGLENWIDLGSDPVRGSLVIGATLYVVVGNSFYSVDTEGGYTLISILGTTSGIVSMATNGVDIVIVDGYSGYVYDLEEETLSLIDSPTFPNGTKTISYIDGYYLVSNPNTGQIWRSDWQDGSSWGGLAFSTAGADPDNVVGLIVDHGDVWVIGEYTTEIWYNTGAQIFNFARIEGALIEQGGVSPYGVCKANNAVYWVGRDRLGNGQIFQAVGRQPKVISTPPIVYALSQYTTIDDVVSFAYQMGGHVHVVFTFPSAKATWVYDSTVGLWHERSSRIDGDDTYWRGICHSVLSGSHIVGDWSTGKLYKMKSDVYDEGGEVLISTRISQIIRKVQNRITIDEIKFLCEVGVGLVTGEAEDVDPMALVSWSRDGGNTWSPEVDVPLGKIGEYDFQPKVRQLGQGRNWVIKLRISAAVKRVILGAIAEVEENE